MATTEDRTASTGSDTAAIVELQEMVERQRAGFLADPFPSLQERQELLGTLAGMVMSHRTEIQEALSSDFGVHPPVAADLIEVLGPAGRAVYAAEQLPGWMASEPRHSDPLLYGSGRAYVQPQPMASSATSCRGTSPSTCPSGRSSRCSPPATALSSSRRSTRPPVRSCCAR